ncbi:uncharacterized protein N7483_012145 [Penicillium malachiteum]|uniref:uncharacterized protein n=1 Tax=Penicillium malachiteum TaxID=1324776 RepID=UPI002546D167|nr:uncharacterized protein N7483_012145 [Penicillium malachiteum]KAJ5714964.1 hypothetical protein N7483_012145 [Penicillium malachiteum]
MQEAKTPEAVIHALRTNPAPVIIIITDQALTLKEHAHVWNSILTSVRQGSTAVITGSFSSFARPNDLKSFFSKAGLPWESGTYQRTTVVLNSEATGTDLAKHLPKKYSQKALFLKNVAPSESWYLTNADSVLESHVFAPQSAYTPGESPIVLGRVGEGRLGYVGDVNGEDATQVAVVAMCGFLA